MVSKVGGSVQLLQDYWAVAAETVDGRQFCCGEAEQDFVMHSVVKPLMYALAVEDFGAEQVREKQTLV